MNRSGRCSLRSRSRLRSPAVAPAKRSRRSRSRWAVGGKTALYYLPLTVCERLGYFKEQGLDVTINDFRGGAQSLQALVGGSVDVVTGAYEHTIRMQAKGQDIRAVIELGRFPGIVVGLRKDKAASYKSAADLKGIKIGVSAPGSSTNFFVMYLMSKAGLKPADASYIGVGIGPSAVAAMKKGDIDALSNLDPMITKLEQDGDIKVIADSRTEEGTRAIFGGSNPAAVLYVKQDFIDKEPQYDAGAGQRVLQDAQVAGEGDARSRSPRPCPRSISSATGRSTSPRSRPTSRSIRSPA